MPAFMQINIEYEYDFFFPKRNKKKWFTYAFFAAFTSEGLLLNSQNFTDNSKQFILARPLLSSVFSNLNASSGCWSDRNIGTSTVKNDLNNNFPFEFQMRENPKHTDKLRLFLMQCWFQNFAIVRALQAATQQLFVRTLLLLSDAMKNRKNDSVHFHLDQLVQRRKELRTIDTEIEGIHFF